jgi:hypothetical protein
MNGSATQIAENLETHAILCFILVMLQYITSKNEDHDGWPLQMPSDFLPCVRAQNWQMKHIDSVLMSVACICTSAALLQRRLLQTD